MIFKKGYKQLMKIRRFQSLSEKVIENMQMCVPESEYNVQFLCDPSNHDYIANNIRKRKSLGNIDKVLELSQKPEQREEFLKELSKIPNNTDPFVLDHGEEPYVLKVCGSKPEFDFNPVKFDDIAHHLKLIKVQGLGPLTGSRSYILLGDLAALENILVHYTIQNLMKHGFQLMSVPDIIPTKIIEKCGLVTDGERTLIYNLDNYYEGDYSLSGTAEMALAAKLMNARLSYKDLPLKMAAVSRCYRAEVSKLHEERGIYRVHQFTKVEMFICSEPGKSLEMFEYLQTIQEHLFSSLGLHFHILDMPAHELGPPAYRKIDMEGWMPGRKQFGELSSCSNCTDYQARRLNIKYQTKTGELVHVHTLNGTACAIPRMLIALSETYQTKHGRIQIPNVLLPYFNGKTLIKKQPVASFRRYK